MNIFDFITQDELEDLPEDPSEAFVTFVRHAQRRLDERVEKINAEYEEGWRLVNDAHHGFVNVVSAAAKRYEIVPFVSKDVPLVEQFKDMDYNQFKADLDHYLTQMILDATVRNRRDGITLAPKAQDKIRQYVHGLKMTIDQSDFSEAKKTALLECIAEFEKELDKRRLNLMAVTRLSIAILAVPGSLWASADVAMKLTTNILQVVGESKAADDENRKLPSQEPAKALLPPRADQPDQGRGRKTKPDGTAIFRRDDMDDEIPF